MIRCYVTDRRQGDLMQSARRCIDTGVDYIQIREKDLPAAALLELTVKIRDLAAGSATRVLLNDRLDVALAAQIDGVHLPAYGLPAVQVRPRVRILGVSTHSMVEAVAAEHAQADFIIFGPIFDTPGKQAVGLEALRSVTSAVHIPVLAIGGITHSNAGQIIEAGAAGIAAIRLFQGGSTFSDSR
jgi:thiamine-phosphate pyrophosphorylase